MLHDQMLYIFLSTHIEKLCSFCSKWNVKRPSVASPTQHSNIYVISNRVNTWVKVCSITTHNKQKQNEAFDIECFEPFHLDMFMHNHFEYCNQQIGFSFYICVYDGIGSFSMFLHLKPVKLSGLNTWQFFLHSHSHFPFISFAWLSYIILLTSVACLKLKMKTLP